MRKSWRYISVNIIRAFRLVGHELGILQTA